MSDVIGAVSGGGGGGADEKDFGPVYEFLNGKYMGQQGMPSVDFGGPAGDGGLSVGGNPTFAGKGFGGGGFGIMDIGGAFTGAMMSSNPNFTHNLYGLPATDRKTGAPINYGAIFGNKGSTPGVGHDFSDTTGEINSVPSVETWAKSREGVPSFVTNSLEMQMGMDPSSFLDPTTPTPFQPETGIFGGTLGPKLRNSLPGKIIRGALQINPGTKGLMMGMALIRGAKNAENPQAFLKKAFKQIAIQTAMGKLMGGKGLGLDSMQQKGVGSLMNVAQGEQNWRQALGSLGTSAAFQKLGMPLIKKAFQSGGMPAVYGMMSALNMTQKGAQRGLSKKLAGPPGGG